jgi:hypothetical protein
VSPAYISTEHIDYLQRAREKDQPGLLSAMITQPLGLPDQRRWWHITRIGRLEKQPAQVEQNKPRLSSEDLLSGLYGSRVPVVFLLRGTPDKVNVHLGTWSEVGTERGDTNAEILRSGLQSLYPSFAASLAQPTLTGVDLSGLALGIPTVKPSDPLDGAVAVDRLVRAMEKTNWACLVIAQPAEEQVITKVRFGVVNELRESQAALRSLEDEQVVKHYNELLTVSLTTLTTGLAGGMWRTTVYLLGDSISYPRLASLWRGIFSGDESLPEPVRVWEREGMARMITDWSIPDAPGRKGPGSYRHPFEYQTLLTSKQLSAYIHLPQVETTGFAVQAVPDFDAVPPPVEDEAVFNLGEVMLQSRPTGSSYAIRRRDLTRHAFVAGVTGAGKTNTIFHLLKQLDSDGVRFLVIEPAKQEYRALLNEPDVKDRLHVFTLGEERVAPFRLNPFEVVGWPRISVGVHLDLLRSVFVASFGMWTPLPQILEQCLHQVYEDRGWDITANTNHRLNGATDPSPAFPTLSELAVKVEEVTRALGYEDRVTADMRAALLTRINSLRTGGKGRMLDVQHSLPMKLLLEHPSVLELEGMGDDDDKAFMMGLLFIRLVEHRRVAGPSEELQHLLVFEEAHRLLTNVGERREEEGNARGKAVETFANLLSEIRAYGQGILIADQVPVKLAPEVIKNTNLKIVHRVVAADDRAVLAGAMAMNERQAHALATLERGQAAIFSEGDDAPVVVQVPLVKGGEGKANPTSDQVTRTMSASHALAPFRSLFRPLQREVSTHVENPRTWDAARRIVELRTFQSSFARLVVSAIEDVQTLERQWPELIEGVRKLQPRNILENDLVRCVMILAAQWFAQRRGAQYGWSYQEMEGLAQRLEQMLLDHASKKASIPLYAEFKDYALRLHARTFDPFARCSKICKQKPLVCVYRYSALDLIQSGVLNNAWRAAEERELAELRKQSERPHRREISNMIPEAGVRLVAMTHVEEDFEPVEEAKAALRRAGLCFVQQMLTQDPARLPSRVNLILDELLQEVGHG